MVCLVVADVGESHIHSKKLQFLLKFVTIAKIDRKTTLLNCIVGLRVQDSGSITLFGNEVNGTQGNDVGYMPQVCNTFLTHFGSQVSPHSVI